jgi:hypothetical protein
MELAERGEVFGGGQVAQGLVRPIMIVRLFPLPQRRLERRQFEIAVVELPEFLAVGAVAALDVPVELRGAGRQHEQVQPSLLPAVSISEPRR